MTDSIAIATAANVYSAVKPTQKTWENLCDYFSSPNPGDKEGSLFVLAKLPAGRCKNDSVEHVSALVFDVDNKTITPLTIQQMEDNLRQLDLKSIIYTTHSHTAQSPRFRVVLAVDKPIPPKTYHTICRTVANYLGVEKYIDTSCFNPARRYFEPRCPEERIDQFDFKEIEGEPLKINHFLTYAPMRNHHIGLSPLAQSLSITELPRTERSVARLLKALDYIDADCSYSTYIRVVWGILATGWDAVEIARNWSMTAPHRFEEHCFQNLIRDFDPVKEEAIGVGTLFNIAKEGGFHG